MLPLTLGASELPLTLLLACPILGAALLALLGHTRIGAEVNVLVSAATTACALWLTAEVARGTTILVYHELFFIDSLNVLLVTLTRLLQLK